MENLIEISRNRIQTVGLEFQRYLLKELPIDQRLIFIRGARGSGKTMMQLQFLKLLQLPVQETLYLSLDDILFSTVGLVEFADWFYKTGGKYLALDEVHKYPNWSKEIKTVYDRYPGLNMMVTCSSALQLSEGDADLSRRALTFHLNELSLREFTELRYGIKLPAITLESIINNHEQITLSIVKDIKPLQVFNEYLKYGAYPFFVEGEKFYLSRLLQVIQLVLEGDLPALENLSYGTVVKLRKLLGIIAEIVPFKPNVSELGDKLGVSRDQVLKLLFLLEKAQIIYQLRNNSFGMSYLTKPEKIYLHNPNIAEAITHSQTNRGTSRETFFINQISGFNSVYYSSTGDFMVNNKYTFEIGGVNKKKKQLSNVENGFIVKDDIEHGVGSTIPLWLFGFLY